MRGFYIEGSFAQAQREFHIDGGIDELIEGGHKTQLDHAKLGRVTVVAGIVAVAEIDPGIDYSGYVGYLSVMA